MRIGVVLPNWIGDVVMATPTLRAIAKHYGERATLTGILRPYTAELLDGLSWLDECLYYQPRAQDASLRTVTLVRNLRSRHLDLIVLLTNSLRTGMIAGMSGAKRRLGYARNGRGWLLTEKLYPSKQDNRLVPVSAVDYYLGLAYALGCPSEPRQLELATTEQSERAADEVWQRYGLSNAAQVVVLNPGGAYGSAKHWPKEYFAELAQRLVRQRDTAVLILCGPGERDVAAEIERLAAQDRVVSLARERFSLGLSKACVRRSQLMVTTDSGPRHFAAAFRVPAITLFGPTDPQWSLNYHPDETVLQEKLPCVPCGERICPLQHHACMRQLVPEKVTEVACQWLESGPRANQAQENDVSHHPFGTRLADRPCPVSRSP